MYGKVKWFNQEKGYGFVVGDGEEEDRYFNVRMIKGAELPSNGDIVEFEPTEGPKGLRAAQVKIIDRASDHKGQDKIVKKGKQPPQSAKLRGCKLCRYSEDGRHLIEERKPKLKWGYENIHSAYCYLHDGVFSINYHCGNFEPAISEEEIGKMSRRGFIAMISTAVKIVIGVFVIVILLFISMVASSP